ncbi:excisionase family DNA-binding protein [Sporosarcina trichiuri]|uniref:excisionase family DNA-binding protein n=1 Tax=Sporosarcina trichiuri TaxID=3056445 RepID=UPI0025B28E17|nr:excisionase family DNA-binding protein [Sporosarcina sp. 0.2-SM1T-5]WJY26661.1 excisionase family DNA-binding protein [Sporosarcina sp. 0.2-SM1T-5]
MYLTMEETADQLGMPLEQVRRYVLNGKIRAVHDGNDWLINEDQFSLYFEQLKLLKQQIDDWLNEPIPPDRDIKDED